MTSNSTKVCTLSGIQHFSSRSMRQTPPFSSSKLLLHTLTFFFSCFIFTSSEILPDTFSATEQNTSHFPCATSNSVALSLAKPTRDSGASRSSLLAVESSPSPYFFSGKYYSLTTEFSEFLPNHQPPKIHKKVAIEENTKKR